MHSSVKKYIGARKEIYSFLHIISKTDKRQVTVLMYDCIISPLFFFVLSYISAVYLSHGLVVQRQNCGLQNRR